jgi:hypothetical protein
MRQARYESQTFGQKDLQQVQNHQAEGRYPRDLRKHET